MKLAKREFSYGSSNHSMDSIEILILKNLINDDEFLRKVIFLKKDYFQDYSQDCNAEEISSFC